MKPVFLFCFAASLLAQDAAPGWHRFGERTDGLANMPQQGSVPGNLPGNVQGLPQQQPPAYQQSASQGPVDLTIAPGTWITVHVNEPLSSDHSQPGDAFMATLAQPLVVNGLVIARRGQAVQGRVGKVVKAGRVKGVSSLGVELTELGLVDGQQVPLRTQLMERRGDTSVGRDIGALGVTTGLGAAIGAAAGGGLGAGIGAAAGAVLGTTGVLTTRGRETVLFPEQVLTFRIEEPVHISSQAAYAFQPGSASEYERPTRLAQAPVARPYPVLSPYVGYPYFGDFGGYFYSGPRFYYGRGRYRRW